MRRRRTQLAGPSKKESEAQPDGKLSRETVRLLPLLLPISVLGAAVVVAAGAHFAASSPTTKSLVGTWALLAVTALAEAFPRGVGLVSFATTPAGRWTARSAATDG
jgi:hypothetical protein